MVPTHLEALHDELVRTCDELNVVVVVKLIDDIVAKQKAGAAWGHAPASDV
jgi:hypothetical protein